MRSSVDFDERLSCADIYNPPFSSCKNHKHRQPGIFIKQGHYRAMTA